MVDEQQPGINGRKPTMDFLDRRVTPRGVLPRHLQTWAMLAVAGAMLLVILVTGHPNAPRPRGAGALPLASPSALPPDRLRRYQEQLTQEEARLRHELDEAQTQAQAQTDAQAQAEAQARANGTAMPGTSPGRGQAQPDPIAEERRRREYTSLFAESLVLTRRSNVSSQLPAHSSDQPAPNTQHAAPSTEPPHPAQSNPHRALTTQHPARSTPHPARSTPHPALTTHHPAPSWRERS